MPISGKPEIGGASPESILTGRGYGLRAPSLRSGPGMTAERLTQPSRKSSARPALVRDKSCLGHQVLVQRVVLLQELEHVRAGEEDRLERLFLHVVLVFGRLRELLHQVDVERGLLRRHLPRKEYGAQ